MSRASGGARTDWALAGIASVHPRLVPCSDCTAAKRQKGIYPIMTDIVWNPTGGNTHSPGPGTAENFTVAAGETRLFILRTPALGRKCSVNLQSGGGETCMHGITVDGYTWSKSPTPEAKLIVGDTVPGGPAMPPKFQGLKPDTDYVVKVTTEGTQGPYKWHLNCNNVN